MKRIFLSVFLFASLVSLGQKSRTNGHFNTIEANKVITTEVVATKITGIDSTEIDNTNGPGDSLVLFTSKGIRFKKLRVGNNIRFDYVGDSVIIINAANYASAITFHPRAGEAVIATEGFSGVTAGTATARPLSTTNTLGATARVGLVSAATAASSVYFTSATNFLWRGNAVGKGGFTSYLKFALPSNVTNSMAFFGLTVSTISAVANPSTLPNIIGVAKDDVDGTFQFMTNDDVGNATKVNTTIPINSTDLYELFITAVPGASDITLTLNDVSQALSSTVTLSSDLPLNSVFLKPELFLSNNTTAAVIAIDVSKIYAETRY